MISILGQAAALALFAGAMAAFGVLVKGCLVLRRQARATRRDDSAVLLKSVQVPKVSVVAVVEEMSEASRAFVRRLLDLHFSNHEVVLVLDGADFDQWTAEYRLVSNSQGTWTSLDPLRLVVLRTGRGDRAAAFNAGVAAASGAIIGLFDPAGDFVPEALLRLIPPMLQSPKSVSAVCGISPETAGGSLVQRFAALESLRMWLARCAAFSGWNMLIPVPGCCLLIRRDAIQKAGGFQAGPMELVLHLHGQARTGGAKFRMALVVEPVCHLPAPGSRSELRDRTRADQRALAGALGRRKQIAGGLQAIGWGVPALVCSRLVRPAVETGLYVLAIVGVATKLIPWQAGILAMLCTIGAGMLLSMAAVVLRELSEFRGSDPRQLAGLFFAAIPENLGYRQVRNLWLLAGFSKSKN